ncbi:hypothetical protein [Glutamicibacter halophytocola]|uniref:hypothetical protein n=1 Tax=Glutamicibacter halophytocola TaxID=1933880 RepID=UPI001892B183|nr:hypothetical protein [Glutamicibacter halophytocola]
MDSAADSFGVGLGATDTFVAFLVTVAFDSSAGGSALTAGAWMVFGSSALAGADFFTGAGDSDGSAASVSGSTAVELGSDLRAGVSADVPVLPSDCFDASAVVSSGVATVSVSWVSTPAVGSAATAKPGIVTAIHNAVDEITAKSGFNSFLDII